MDNPRPGLDARKIMAVASAVALVTAIVLILGRGASDPASLQSPPNSPPPSVSSRDPAASPSKSEAAALVANLGKQPSVPLPGPSPLPHAAASGQDPDEPIGKLGKGDWLPNPEGDFGAEDAYFEARYGKPTPELIRSSLSRALRAQDPDRNWTPEEEKRAADALVSLRQHRLAMRALPFTAENGDERQELLNGYREAVTELQIVTDQEWEFIIDPGPAGQEPSGIVHPGGGGGPDHFDPADLPVGPDFDTLNHRDSSPDEFLRGVR